jgi:20S proteasome alpha/beta subunit
MSLISGQWLVHRVYCHCYDPQMLRINNAYDSSHFLVITIRGTYKAMTRKQETWIFEPSEVYNYDMTFVAGLIADDGIVCIGDGRVKDRTGNLHTDREVKLFVLSSRCVLMPAGGVFKEIDSLMMIFKTTLVRIGRGNVSEIARIITEAYRDTDDDESSNQSMVFAGYDHEPDGTIMPVVCGVHSLDWVLRLPTVGRTYIPGGVVAEAIEFLDREYQPMQHKTLLNVNKVALRAMRYVMARQGKSVNGDIALWNILPNKETKKFTQEEIKGLENEYTN